MDSVENDIAIQVEQLKQVYAEKSWRITAADVSEATGLSESSDAAVLCDIIRDGYVSWDEGMHLNYYKNRVRTDESERTLEIARSLHGQLNELGSSFHRMRRSRSAIVEDMVDMPRNPDYEGFLIHLTADEARDLINELNLDEMSFKRINDDIHGDGTRTYELSIDRFGIRDLVYELEGDPHASPPVDNVKLETFSSERRAHLVKTLKSYLYVEGEDMTINKSSEFTTIGERISRILLGAYNLFALDA